jgi:serine/threonine protein kinase/WD40 repeat protein
VETLVGSTLSGYTLTRIIGSGGMGTVYLAEDKAIGQQVAIKVVRTEDSEYADIMSRGQVAERFKQEARAVAKLDHLNILPLYRYGEEKTHNGLRSYMVMQYRPEGSLWGWLRRRAEIEAQIETSATNMAELPPGLPTGWPLQKEEVADYLSQAAAALQYAHDRNFIHRDVKPENFLLRFDKNPIDNSYKAFLLLSDFGLAKFFSNLSSTSQILGTPTYMAPEQFSGNACPESDQYALAVMVYCLLAGQPPFNGDPIYLMHQHLTAEPPSIRIFAPKLSARVEAVLDKALAKTPSERYQSITEFADAFTQSIHEGQKTTPTAVPPSKSPLSRSASQQQSLSQSRLNDFPAVPVHPFMAIPTASHPIQAQPNNVNNMQNRNAQASNFSFDASPGYISHQVLQEPQAPSLTPQQRQATTRYNVTPQPIVISEPGQVVRPDNNALTQWTGQPDQISSQTDKQVVSRRTITRWIIGGAAAIGIGAAATGIFLANNKVGALSTISNPAQQTTSHIKHILRGHALEVSSLAWAPDGSKLASGSLDHSVRLWDLNLPTTPLIIKKHALGVLSVAWQPDGTQLASGGQDNVVDIYDTSNANADQTYTSDDGVGTISKIAWGRDGKRLFIGTLGDGLEEITLKDQNVDTVKSKGAAEVRTLAASPDGNYLALGSDAGILVILTLPDFHRFFVGHPHTGSIHALTWSPNSALLASGGADKTTQIFDINTQNTTHSSVYSSVVNDIAWRPDQSQSAQGTGQIAVALADSTMQIWTIDANTHTTYKGHTKAVTSIAWGNQGLATGSTDKNIIIWNI